MILSHQEPLRNLELRTHRSRIISISLIIAFVAGFLLVVYLIIDSGAADVAHAMSVIGWWLIPIALFHLVPLTFSALSWRELLPAASRPHAVTLIAIRWIRESINSLLPVASVGGDIASVRLAQLQGVPARHDHPRIHAIRGDNKPQILRTRRRFQPYLATGRHRELTI